ncbi:murein L,D-transpeptidase family protein [Magnetospira sp. QH-2]|uniref:L,D-transpeptidase family protein n=1 Tax=Magnetospira sp. (strain QH-2) TaxID=1288970 RepID=UPI0003E81635|nr:L,D-transpeptidase family protein [Magnetospira sp. QH-2]CCQ75020.1 conserved protein of unknown function[Include L, D-transpeptidase catalytic domain] [Magnetospira sp. QH-2]
MSLRILLLSLLLSGLFGPVGMVPGARAQQMLATLVEIHKSQRLMVLKWGENTLATYRISLGSNPIGHKRAAGDGRTPEGNYKVTAHLEHPEYKLALRISYPSSADTAVARARAVDPGGDIYIHGQPEAMIWDQRADVLQDWTNGSISVTTREMRKIWERVPDGTPIAILP